MKHLDRLIALIACSAFLYLLAACQYGTPEIHSCDAKDEIEDLVDDNIKAPAKNSDPCETSIVFSEDGAEVRGPGAGMVGDDLLISDCGVYTLSGTLSGGSVIVDCGTDSSAALILNNFSVNSPKAAVYVLRASSVTIEAPENTENSLSGIFSSKNPYSSLFSVNAVICSKSDISLEGLGTITIHTDNSDAVYSDKSYEIHGNVYVDD